MSTKYFRYKSHPGDFFRNAAVHGIPNPKDNLEDVYENRMWKVGYWVIEIGFVKICPSVIAMRFKTFRLLKTAIHKVDLNLKL